MAQWGATDVASNSVNYGARLINKGRGHANVAANNTTLFDNTTPDAFKSGLVVGQFGVSVAEMANTTGESAKVTHAGWNLRKEGAGPIVGLTVTGGTNFTNGETMTVSNGQVNATAVLTTNATGNLVSAAVTTGGRFTARDTLVYTFARDVKFVANVTVTGTTSGYDNTDVVTVSNGSVNATATVSTNATGGITNASFTVSARGKFPAAAANSDVVVAIANSSGGNSAGTGATFSAKVANSTGGTPSAPVMGGRYGRVNYETLVAFGSLTDGTADDAVLPQA